MKVRGLIVFVSVLLFAPAVNAQVLTDPANLEHEAVAAGFIGASSDELGDGSFDFGGSLSWLWNQSVGPEFLIGFAPYFSADGVSDETQVGNYMANVIAALPIGADAQWRPFVSGGIGALTIRDQDDEFDLDAPDASDWAANVGGGLMAFAGPWGFRGDVRYFSQIGRNPGGGSVNAFLEDLDFVRANAGVAFRW